MESGPINRQKYNEIGLNIYSQTTVLVIGLIRGFIYPYIDLQESTQNPI